MMTQADKSPNSQRTQYRAHWTIFLPALVIIALYGGIWLISLGLGRGEGGLARLALQVAILGGPLLLLHAYLRYHFLGLVVGRRELRYRRGWVRPKWRRVAIAEIVSARGGHNLFSGGSNAGPLVLTLRDGRRLRLDDMERAVEAAGQINQHLRAAGVWVAKAVSR